LTGGVLEAVGFLEAAAASRFNDVMENTWHRIIGKFNASMNWKRWDGNWSQLVPE